MTKPSFHHTPLPYEEPGDDLYDGWMDRQFEKLHMAYCVDCKCFVDPFISVETGEHEGHRLVTTAGEKTSEEVIARLSE
ncbi:hypothetical protein LCGC14_2073910 [marine sediment metagenome]|uniref:Uncharacterized protein n=1 Tax=marine sediment metagenome TaxID=412755 RepID=A0A0F9F4W9_9ZZZZ